jgi:REG-2-like HAD superfamily hydrolase
VSPLDDSETERTKAGDTLGIPLRGVLFDATGTLIETREPVGEVYSRVALEHGVELSARRLGDAFKRILARAPSRAFPSAKPDEIEALERGWWREIVRMTLQATDSTLIFKDLDAFFSQLYQYYESAAAWRLRSGAAQALVELHLSGLRIGLVSNFDQRIRKILQVLDIMRYFNSITIPATCGLEKPDPLMFRRALADLGIEADEVVYIGDDPEKDLAGARNAGLRTLDVNALSCLDQLPNEIGPASANPACTEVSR